ncbi:MAG: hypothetical protein AAB250_05195 [Bdellovibrionota bacterium]
MIKHISSILVVALALMPAAHGEVESCQLVDHQEYRELSAAVNALGQALQANSRCQGADVKGMMSAQEQLRQNSAKLMGYMNNPAATGDVGALTSSLTGAVSSVDSISAALSNSSFLKSECGQSMATSGKVLTGLAEVSMALTPIALAVGAMTGAVKVAIPVALGISGLYSAFKILGGLTSTKTFDIRNYEHRQLILRSTCEYSRINQRIKYLMLMQSGDITGVRREMAQRVQELDRSLAGRPNLQKLVQLYRGKLSVVNDGYDEVRDARKALFQLRSQLGRYAADRPRMCAFAQIQAKKPIAQNVLLQATPILATTVAAFPPSSVLLDEASASDAIQRVNERKAKEILLVDALPGNIDLCVSSTMSWVDSTAESLNIAERTLREREAKLKRAINREPAYRAWAAQVVSVESDRALLEQLLPMMQSRSEPGSAITRADLFERERDIRRILLGAQGGWKIPFMGASSLVGQWIQYSLGHYKEARRTFEKGFLSLDKETHTEPGDIIIIAGGDPMAAAATIVVPVDDLKLLTLKRFPKRTRGWQNACRRLDDIYLTWLRAQDHFNATRFLCRTIDLLIGEDIEAEITKTCKGGLSIDNRSAPISTLQSLVNSSARTRRNATLVQAKRTELQCPIMKEPGT